MKNKSSTHASKIIKLVIILLLSVFTILAGSLGVSIVGVLQSTPTINTNEIDDMMKKTSEILDSDGNPLETVQTEQYRDLVTYDELPKNLVNAFISIEDVRFNSHKGVDPLGIMSSIVDNVKSSGLERGASTLAQQLARNLYLSSDKKIERKIKEAYLALQLTEELGRDGVVEKYLNTVFLGQNAYGVQAASKVYFDKDVGDLTLGECAALASIVKSPSNFALYKTVLPENVTENDKIIENGDIELNGTMYKTIYNSNENLINREQRTLSNMKKQGYITKEEYEAATSEDIAAALKPGKNSTKQNISSYYVDLIADQVIEKLQSELGLTKDEAIAKYYNGGLKIYSTIDTNMQNKVEDIFTNFSSVVLGNAGSSSRPALLDWSADRSGNITSSKGEIAYYKKANLISGENQVYINKGDFSVNTDGSLTINSDKLSYNSSALVPKNFYTVNDENNLVTYIVRSSGEAIAEKGDIEKTDSGINLSKSFLDKYNDFYSLDDSGNLILGAKYFSVEDGVPQPQGSIVVVDHKNGQIKAIVGGRNKDGRKILNRASDVPRQPGSSMKPLAVYTPALDNGYTAASGIDDVPFYDYSGKLWPKNVYNGYKGITSLRNSVKDSINVNAVKTLEDIGIDTAKDYLAKFGVIDKENTENDSFITAAENKEVNDEVLSLALGGMTEGVTNLKMTGAYAALANGGEYIEPLTFSKVLDYDDSVLLEDVNDKNTVVSEDKAYVMTSVMEDVLTVPYGNRAKSSKFDIAGKTGTTQDNQDVWFVGYTPYYTIGSWVGFDNQQLKLSTNGGQAVDLWKSVNTSILEGYDGAKFKEPDSIVHMKVCTIGNGKPTKACYADPRGMVKDEVFAKGTEPTKSCTIHKFSGSGVILVRPIPYDPAKNNYIYPDDWYLSGFGGTDEPSEETKETEESSETTESKKPTIKPTKPEPSITPSSSETNESSDTKPTTQN